MPQTQEYWVLEGDWGGQIYLTTPMKDTPQGKIAAALIIISAPDWDGLPDHLGNGTSYYAVRGYDGAIVFGGMGGGQVRSSGMWLHEKLMPSQKKWVQDFFTGKTDLPSPEEMFFWLKHEAMDWQWLNDEITARMWLKKFQGRIRLARKALHAELTPVKPINIGEVINDGWERQ